MRNFEYASPHMRNFEYALPYGPKMRIAPPLLVIWLIYLLWGFSHKGGCNSHFGPIWEGAYSKFLMWGGAYSKFLIWGTLEKYANMPGGN